MKPAIFGLGFQAFNHLISRWIFKPHSYTYILEWVTDWKLSEVALICFMHNFFWQVSFDENQDILEFRHTNAFKIKRYDCDSWSKMLIFKREFHKVRVLPHFCQPHSFWPLLRAFKWGTTKGFSSRGIRMLRG